MTFHKKRRRERYIVRDDMAETARFELAGDCSLTDFESFSHLTKIGQFGMDFRQFYPRQKAHYTRLFAFEALKNPHFSGTGSNRRFFGFWEEKWIDWEEKMIEGNTPKNGFHIDKIMFEV